MTIYVDAHSPDVTHQAKERRESLARAFEALARVVREAPPETGMYGRRSAERRKKPKLVAVE